MSNYNHSPFHRRPRPGSSSRQILSHSLWLGGATAILLLSWFLSTGDQRQVVLPGFGVIPEICTLRTRVGVDCPGCGLTRSFIHLAHGDLRTAWSLNPVGLFLFAFVASQIPLVLSLLWSDIRIGNTITARVVPRESNFADYDNAADTPLRPSSLQMAGPNRPSFLNRWLYWNQWMLIGLILALVLRWIAKLTLGGGWG